MPIKKFPHPRLSWITWVALFVIVLAGSIIYWLSWFRPLLDAEDSYVTVNGVVLPREISGFRIKIGGVRGGMLELAKSRKLPGEGVLEGVVYGDPQTGVGVLLFTAPKIDSGNLGEYVTGSLSLMGMEDLSLEEASLPSIHGGKAVIASGARSGNDSVIGIGAGVSIGGQAWLLFGFTSEDESAHARESLLRALDDLARQVRDSQSVK